MSWRLKKRTIENTQAEELLNLFGYSMPMPHRPCCGAVHYLDHAAYYKYYSTYYTILPLLVSYRQEKGGNNHCTHVPMMWWCKGDGAIDYLIILSLLKLLLLDMISIMLILAWSSWNQMSLSGMVKMSTSYYLESMNLRTICHPSVQWWIKL